MREFSSFGRAARAARFIRRDMGQKMHDARQHVSSPYLIYLGDLRDMAKRKPGAYKCSAASHAALEPLCCLETKRHEMAPYDAAAAIHL